MRKIGGISFGPVIGMSGVTGFFTGKEYPYHALFRKIVPGFAWAMERMVPCAKTTTLLKRVGNMPLGWNYRPVEFLPRCIICGPRQFRYGVALNAVSLSGPGAQALLDDGRWQDMAEPFFLSFMSVAETVEDQIEEFRLFARMLVKEQFKAKVALQINLSCPNVGAHDQSVLVYFAGRMTEVANEESLEMPLVFKLSAAETETFGVKQAAQIAALDGCAGLCVSNTIPFGWNGINGDDWEKYFPGFKTGNTEMRSPLKRRGFQQEGGLSGAPLLPVTVDWIRRFRQLNSKCPIIGGGGILHPEDVDRMAEAGADKIAIGSAAFLRPWRLEGIIARAHKLLGE